MSHDNMASPIAHVLPFSGVGGTEIATLRLAKAARNNGFQSIIYHLEDADPVRDLFAQEGFPTATYSDKIYFSLRNSARWLTEMRRFAASLRNHGAGAFHASDVRAASLAAPAGRIAGIPVLCHVRNRLAQLPLIEKIPLAAVQRFVFVSQATWEQFGYTVSADRGEVLYDGFTMPSETSPAEVRRSVREELSIAEDQVVVAMVARLAPQKDYLTLAQAAAQVIARRPNVRFLLIGSALDPSYGDQVAAWMRQYGVSEHVKLLGFRSDIPRLLAGSDVFLLCTHFEGFPLVILEAMALEKPVIATAVDGIPEIVQQDKTGLLHGHKNADELAVQLLRLIENPDLRQHLAAAGKHLVRSRFSTEVYENAVGQFYRRVLGPSA